MEFLVLGCGDAFGSGGRFNTCFHVTTPDTRFLIDCGTSALIAMRRYEVDPNGIDTVFVTHLHGDHFGGLPFVILDAQHVSHRATPLTIVGPPGLRDRLTALMEAMFPGSSVAKTSYELNFIEIEANAPAEVNGVGVTAFPVRHPSGAPSYALRFTFRDKVLCYTGDTEWVDTIVQAANKSDIFIAECYTKDKVFPYHNNFAALQKHFAVIDAKLVLLTHMSADMLRHEVDECKMAEDGLTLLF